MEHRVTSAIPPVSGYKKSIVLYCLTALLVFLALSSIVQADTRGSDSDWQFAAELYLWYTSIGGSTATDGDLEIDAKDLVNDLNMAFMGNIAARKDRWGLMLDALYLNASDNQNTQLGRRRGCKRRRRAWRVGSLRPWWVMRWFHPIRLCLMQWLGRAF